MFCFKNREKRVIVPIIIIITIMLTADKKDQVHEYEHSETRSTKGSSSAA